MHPYLHAQTNPDKAALIMAGSGETVTYRKLDDRSNQGAQLFRAIGLQAGDGIAFFIENHPRYYELLWAAQRAGLRFTCLSSKLTVDEVAYILQDCQAKAFITSTALLGIAVPAAAQAGTSNLYVLGESASGFENFEAARARYPATPIADQTSGSAMLYSSGTTGRPKGVKRAGVVDPDIAAPNTLAMIGTALYGWTADTIYLSPAPLYHAAPLGWSMAVQSLGGTVVMVEGFDAEAALAAIERHKVTSAQWVPTHFIRMLKLPEDVRSKYDLSSLTAVFHAAAPCPVPVKEAMISWWGPIINEYYAGTEGNGFCVCNSTEWLAHKGSVGKGMGVEVKICDEDGNELPVRSEGLVFFSGGGQFEYYGDPAKTAESLNKHGWSTLGDVGWLDEDGFLYLTDRKSFMIISGGVNIYPQEIENLLIGHPKVADVAVVGAPHEEMGEEVVAVIQPMDWADATPEFAAEVSAWLRERLSHVKSPRRIDFMVELPRHQTGKLYKRLIRDTYWGKAATPLELVPGSRR
jgi:long-chain acyl-CoA synthetase